MERAKAGLEGHPPGGEAQRPAARVPRACHYKQNTAGRMIPARGDFVALSLACEA